MLIISNILIILTYLAYGNATQLKVSLLHNSVLAKDRVDWRINFWRWICTNNLTLLSLSLSPHPPSVPSSLRFVQQFWLRDLTFSSIDSGFHEIPKKFFEILRSLSPRLVENPRRVSPSLQFYGRDSLSSSSSNFKFKWRFQIPLGDPFSDPSGFFSDTEAVRIGNALNWNY